MTPDVDYTAARFWMDLLQLAGIVAIGIYSWWGNRAKVTNSRFNGLETRMTKVESKSGCDHHGDFDKRLRDVQSNVSTIDGRMEGIGRALNLIQEHLLSKGN